MLRLGRFQQSDRAVVWRSSGKRQSTEPRDNLAQNNTAVTRDTEADRFGVDLATQYRGFADEARLSNQKLIGVNQKRILRR